MPKDTKFEKEQELVLVVRRLMDQVFRDVQSNNPGQVQTVQRSELWGVIVCLQAFVPVFIGIDNLNVFSFVSKLLEGSEWFNTEKNLGMRLQNFGGFSSVATHFLIGHDFSRTYNNTREKTYVLLATVHHLLAPRNNLFVIVS